MYRVYDIMLLLALILVPLLIVNTDSNDNELEGNNPHAKINRRTVEDNETNIVDKDAICIPAITTESNSTSHQRVYKKEYGIHDTTDALTEYE